VINVHLDEVLSGIDVTKNLPNDAEPMMSHSKKRNKDMPSSQQKRKHQLSFLAFKVCLLLLCHQYFLYEVFFIFSCSLEKE